jgi:hypothetical protein
MFGSFSLKTIIASCGQTLLHVPQEEQASEITTLPFSKVIAPSGHSRSHIPHARQASWFT